MHHHYHRHDCTYQFKLLLKIVQSSLLDIVIRQSTMHFTLVNIIYSLLSNTKWKIRAQPRALRASHIKRLVIQTAIKGRQTILLPRDNLAITISLKH